MAFSPEELQGHGTHIKRRRVQYSTVLVERQKLRHQYVVDTVMVISRAWVQSPDLAE